MFEKVAYEKWSGRKIYNWLKFEINFKTLCGNKSLTLSNIYHILENEFYYGIFEYPKKSGNWYTGKHESIITKKLFDQVQTQLKGNEAKVYQKKEFAFTKLITCGLCGSGITADEKYKKLKSGEINSYIYYGCTKTKDLNCSSGYIREEELIKELLRIVDEIEIDRLELQDKIKSEIKRYEFFTNDVFGKKSCKFDTKINAKLYIKYILKHGQNSEKRDLLLTLKSKLQIINKKVKLLYM